MEIINKILGKDHDLILTSDWHLGSEMSEESGLEKIKYAMKDRHTYAVIGGDLVEAITVVDKRWNPETDRKLLPLQQYGEVKNFLKPLRHKILGVLLGNHDWKLASLYGNYIKDVICFELGIPYGTYTAKFHVGSYDLFYTHGARSISSVADDVIRREANMQLQLKRRLSMKAGDCSIMAMGHTHRLIVVEPMSSLYLTDDGQKIKAAYTVAASGGEWIHPDHRYYVNTGCLMRLYREGISGYAELMGYDPFEIGFAVIECRGGKVRRIRKEVI